MMKPAANARKTRKMTKMGKAAGLGMTEGIAGIINKKWAMTGRKSAFIAVEEPGFKPTSNSSTNADSLESTPLGVGNDTTKDGNDIGQELEHRVDGGRLDGS